MNLLVSFPRACVAPALLSEAVGPTRLRILASQPRSLAGVGTEMKRNAEK